MPRYPVPPDIREKEKVVGGILTLSQTLILVAGGALTFVLVQTLFKLTGLIPVAILGAAPMAPALWLALGKKKEYGNMEMFQYLILKRRFNRSRKEYPNINENYQTHS